MKKVADRITITADISSISNPELHAVLASIPPGKQRAERLRMLAVKGLTFEQTRTAIDAIVQSTKPSGSGGADDVFGDPLDP